MQSLVQRVKDAGVTAFASYGASGWSIEESGDLNEEVARKMTHGGRKKQSKNRINEKPQSD